MQMLDYQFHLFTEAGTGQDSVLYRAEGGELRLAQLQPASGRITAGSAGSAEAAGAAGFAVSPQPAPALTVGEATQRLDLSGLPFVFFEEIGQGVAGGRGAVLYRRYDGHYGLISPA
jgi:hypothetical protein